MKTLRLQLRFLLPLCLVLVAAAYITVPLVDRLTLRWFLRDLDSRAALVAESVSNALSRSESLDNDELQREFHRALRDERLFALALCRRDGERLLSTPAFPPLLSCADAFEYVKHPNAIFSQDQRDLHVASIPVVGAGTDTYLIVLHDLGFVHLRSADTRQYLIILFVVLGLVIALITVVVAHMSWRGWVAGTRALLRGSDLLGPFRPPPELQSLASELRAMMREMDEERRSRMNTETWTPERLRQLLNTELRGEQVIVVSNREPYIHVRKEDGVQVQKPASGLVTAIEPVMRACSGTWIAHGAGNADRDTVDSRDHVQVPPENPNYTLRRIWLSEEEEQGYYYGFANEGMWPLCHLAHVRPVFRLSDWEYYRVVNQRFADAVAAEARTEDPIVLIQDYHFALLPAMLRKQLPNATIITFWHIPWPNPESFGVCPWHEEILRGMLGSSILGFHTRFHCRNFLESVDRFLESRIRLEESTITFDGAQTQVNSYPISIHWPSREEMRRQPAIGECRTSLRAMLGVEDDHLVAVGVDRFDYTKGIIERFHAVDRLLRKHSELRRRFTFVQFAAPTRSALDEYQLFVQQVTLLSERINQRHGEGGWQPIRLIAEHQDSAAVTRHYRGADCCVVTSLHDGMNLVAKEFIAARDDNQGTLVLSEFTGAARELHTALIVNPYDVESTADALYKGLTMSREEQAQRMRSLRAMVREDNVYRWAANMLLDAARLRRSERLNARLDANDGN
ncbi:MAG: trehalose-6-phosphate synthase [Candidatus Dactylopiibacterium carminicum]|uniref:Trehalose-6-phosphate synthase n=1 Tax=Candidatus Dactylopiibacterium carminicum TaxID=857335 RepID=A0A272ERU4_9RHOO|nr:trehalose-6-phosphate synthase [Candidatus Dactylopiibacterium carminicum]KAF7598889.1 trehalose-6-phosphate synthase [Candidatus Dactylopiibacterium carminicum]PAS92812.1 MAG: trehalose-6-phosphate synthase [Candidatus Dactylopiibacterium carminicum]PAS98907.1 MAG: trehalose-6-phosphate synthase [Candidatus Dactylopiibacterium carminicum]